MRCLAPPAVLGLAMVLGAFPAAAALASKLVVRRWSYWGGRYRRLVLLAVAWAVTEWLRGHIFTGFPWNPLAHVWAFATPLLQGASLVGVYGLGAFTFLILASPAAGWRASGSPRWRLSDLPGSPASRCMEASAPTTSGPIVRIVQPNVPQAEKWRPESRARELQKLIDLSRRDGFGRIAAVVWPETATPFIVQPGSPGLAMLAAAAPPEGYLLAGAARSGADVREGVWNSLLAIDSAGTVTGDLRQGASCAIRRIHPVPQGVASAHRVDRPRLVREGRVVHDPYAAGAAGLLAAHLL